MESKSTILIEATETWRNHNWWESKNNPSWIKEKKRNFLRFSSRETVFLDSSCFCTPTAITALQWHESKKTQNSDKIQTHKRLKGESCCNVHVSYKYMVIHMVLCFYTFPWILLLWYITEHLITPSCMYWS